MAFDVYSDKLCRVNDLSSSFTCPSTHTTSHYQSGWNVARLTELLWEEWEGRLAVVGDQFSRTIISHSGNPLVHIHRAGNTVEDDQTALSDKVHSCQRLIASSLLHGVHMHGTPKWETDIANLMLPDNDVDSDRKMVV